MTKRIVQATLVFMLLIASFASAGGARAWAQCPAYVTVQWGDTLGGIALTCDTTVDAIRAANPGLGWWLYAGQTLYIPTGYSQPPVSQPTYGGTYTVQSGDTLGIISQKTGASVSALLAVNPEPESHLRGSGYLPACRRWHAPTELSSTASAVLPNPASKR